MRRMHGMIAAGMAALLALPAGAQGTLAGRIAAIRDGELQFEFASREDACGDGRSYIRVGDSFIRAGDASITGDWLDDRRETCLPGPVRIVIRKEAGEVVSLSDYLGPVFTIAGRTELGEVSPAEGAAYLLSLAEGLERTRVSKRAIYPAMLGRDVVAWPTLLRIARRGERTGTKSDVKFWLGRYAAAKLQGSDDPFSVERRADTDEEDVKKHAVFALSQLGGREGIDPLLQVARTNKDPVVRAQALFWLGQSGDPRALDLFADILEGRVAPPPRG
ncbi:MAG TPA: HEAT repeat domain-containing protein [Gemmatimonadaceae bacterium]|nr:HEAT repeat domain-containing protein [Gemmatimonadaceae bacterium]